MKSIKVFYNPNQTAENKNSFSPSALKPKLVVNGWLDQSYPIEVMQYNPVTVEDLCLAHDSEYVKNILACTASNGFGNKSQEIAKSLPYTTGSMYAAAKYAFDNKTITVSPTSGFHHACYSSGGGYCTFNGLIVTAQMLKKDPAVKRVAIIDLDQHYGNGTDDIIQHLKLNYIDHFTGGKKHRTPEKAELFLSELSSIIKDTCNNCEIVLYQAGADPHIDDPLGGWLTTKQLAMRDQIVFKTLKEMNIPVAWNLAGGYQKDSAGSIPKVLEIHNNTLKAAFKFYL